MTKLRQVLIAAAALIATGLGVGVAINQSMQQHGMTDEQWCRAVNRISDPQRQERWFVAMPVDTAPPAAHGNHVLGECADGECVIDQGGCAYTYTYERSDAYGGNRMVEVVAHPVIARGWRSWALDTAGAHWMGSYRRVHQACREQFAAARCRNLLQADRKCWLQADGRVCRFGNVLGTCASVDDSTVPPSCVPEQCNYAGARRLPCTVSRGAGSEMQAVNTQYDSNLDPVDE